MTQHHHERHTHRFGSSLLAALVISICGWRISALFVERDVAGQIGIWILVATTAVIWAISGPTRRSRQAH